MKDLFKKCTWLEYLSLGAIIFSCTIAALPFWNGNIDFHTDIARDFLLLEELTYGKHITLIGPRAGGISGVFHGPLWLYLNLPAYIVGHGDPVSVGWFWMGLFVGGIAIVFVTVRRLLDREAAYIGAALFALTQARGVEALFNPFGAVLLFPVFFYFEQRFRETHNIRHLCFAVLAIGCAVQFQMAFAVPIIALFAMRLVLITMKTRHYIFFASLLLFIIPFSTFILFDIRHEFLQIKAVMQYLTEGGGTDEVKRLSFFSFAFSRITQAVSEIGVVIGEYQWVSTIALILIIVRSGFILPSGRKKDIWISIMYYYLGFWIITLAYRGTVWGYYYWPFITGLVVLVVLLKYALHRRYYVSIVILIVISLGNNLYKHASTSALIHSDREGWKLYKQAADYIVSRAPAEYGYYVYSNDQFGYSMKYAMHYTDRRDQKKTGYGFQKKPVTFLLIDDPGDHIYTNHRDWRANEVNIIKKPVRIHHITKRIWVEEYHLTQDEVVVPSSPYLIQDLIFR